MLKTLTEMTKGNNLIIPTDHISRFVIRFPVGDYEEFRKEPITEISLQELKDSGYIDNFEFSNEGVEIISDIMT